MNRVWAAIAAFVGVLAAAALWRWHVWSYGADTGLFTQAIAHSFAGFADGPEQGSHFRFHWSPWLALISPIVLATHQPISLQFVQAILIGLSAVPLYALARTYTTTSIAGSIAILGLIYPPQDAVAFTEFHEIAIYPLVVLGLVFAADRARWPIFAVCALASAFVREEACFVFAIAGAALVALAAANGRFSRPAVAGSPQGLLTGRPLQPRALAAAGFSLVAINLAAVTFYYHVVTPSLGGWEPAIFYTYPFANGPTATLIAMIVHPQNIGAILTFGRLTYVLEAILPLALLPFFSRWSILAIPGFAIILLSSNGIVWRMGSHYAEIWIPWMLVAVVATFARWYREGRERRIRLWMRTAVAICAIVLVAFNPLHPAHYLKAVYADDTPDVRSALAMIPTDAKVVLHDEWFTHVAYDHPYATVFFCPYVDYVVYADDYPSDSFHDQILPEIRAELASGQMREVKRFGKVGVYTRTPDSGAAYGKCITTRPDGFKTLRAFLDYDLERERRGSPG